ncbi:MAG: cell division protein MraZ [Pseudomonadota bacterium]
MCFFLPFILFFLTAIPVSPLPPLDDFQGPDEVVLDAKRRVQLVARHMEVMRLHGINTVDVVMGPEKNVLIYPPQNFAHMLAELKALPKNAVSNKMLQHIQRTHRSIEIDQNNRILLPSAYVSFGEFDKDLMLAGSGRYLSLWSLPNFLAMTQGVSAITPADADQYLPGFSL